MLVQNLISLTENSVFKRSSKYNFTYFQYQKWIIVIDKINVQIISTISILGVFRDQQIRLFNSTVTAYEMWVDAENYPSNTVALSENRALIFSPQFFPANYVNTVSGLICGSCSFILYRWIIFYYSPIVEIIGWLMIIY